MILAEVLLTGIASPCIHAALFYRLPVKTVKPIGPTSAFVATRAVLYLVVSRSPELLVRRWRKGVWLAGTVPLCRR